MSVEPEKTQSHYFRDRELDALPVGQKLFTNGTPMTKMTDRTWATDTLGISYPQSKLCFTHADNPHVVVPEQTKEAAALPETDPVEAKLLAIVEEHFDQGPAAVAKAIKRELRVSLPFTRPLRDAPEPVWPDVGDIWVSKSYRDGEPVRVTELSESEHPLGMKFVRCALVGDISAVGNLIPLSFFNREFTFVAGEPEQPSVGEMWARKNADDPHPGAHFRVIEVRERPGFQSTLVFGEPVTEISSEGPHYTHIGHWKSFYGFISAS